MSKLIVTENELPQKSQDAAAKLRQLMCMDEIGNSNRALLLHPLLGPHWMELGEKIALECDLDPQLREVLILRIAYFYDCSYELHYHLRSAKKVGIDEDMLKLLKEKRTHDFFPKEWQLVIRFCDQINKREIAEYEEVIDCYGREKLIATISLIGFYGFLAGFIYSLQIPLP
jgi:alkylhydroperoxidase family enzyme